MVNCDACGYEGETMKDISDHTTEDGTCKEFNVKVTSGNKTISMIVGARNKLDAKTIVKKAFKDKDTLDKIEKLHDVRPKPEDVKGASEIIVRFRKEEGKLVQQNVR